MEKFNCIEHLTSAAKKDNYKTGKFINVSSSFHLQCIKCMFMVLILIKIFFGSCFITGTRSSYLLLFIKKEII